MLVYPDRNAVGASEEGKIEPSVRDSVLSLIQKSRVSPTTNPWKPVTETAGGANENLKKKLLRMVQVSRGPTIMKKVLKNQPQQQTQAWTVIQRRKNKQMKTFKSSSILLCHLNLQPRFANKPVRPSSRKIYLKSKCFYTEVDIV